MAEIEIERRPRRSGWTWLALLLVLAGVAVGAWLVFGDGIEARSDVTPAAETTPAKEPLTEPVEPLEGPGIPPGEVPEEGEPGAQQQQPPAPVGEPGPDGGPAR